MVVHLNEIIPRTLNFFVKKISELLPYWQNAYSVQALPPVSISIKLPLNIISLPKEFAAKFVDHINIPERKIYIFHNVNVIGAGAIFKNLRIFIPSLSCLDDFNSFRQGHVLIKQWKANLSQISSEPVALIYDYHASINYYHWIVDSLPRLLLLKRLYPNCKLIVPAGAPAYTTITLRLLGFHKLIHLNKYEALNISKLIFPEFSAPQEFQDPSLINQVKNLIRDSFSITKVKALRRIYVSRSRQNIRKIANERDLIDLLTKLGFETIFFEDFTFEEQVKIMMETAVMISVHGANLTNMLFMNPGSLVIELMNKNFNNHCYHSLASATSLDYLTIPCELVKPEINPDNYILNNNADLIVDIDRVSQILKLVID